MAKKYTVELNNHNGKVDVNQVGLSGKDARELAEESREAMSKGGKR